MNKLFCFLLLALPALLLAPAAPAFAQTPSFAWATECGSGAGDYGWGPTQTTTDARGNLYVAGRFTGTIVLGSTILTAPPPTPAAPFANDLFVAKLDSAGNYLWAVQGGRAGVCKHQQSGGRRAGQRVHDGQLHQLQRDAGHGWAAALQL